MPLPSVNKAAHYGFETQRRCNQKSKTWVSVAPQKGLMSSNTFFFKERARFDCTSTPVIPTNVCFIWRNDWVAWLRLHWVPLSKNFGWYQLPTITRFFLRKEHFSFISMFKKFKYNEYNLLLAHFYHPQTKLPEGNVFTPVILSTGRWVLCHFPSFTMFYPEGMMSFPFWSHVPSGGMMSIPVLVPCSFRGI